MELMTQELRQQFPKLGTTDHQPMRERVVYAKFFDPSGSWTWYVFEFDGKDEFFGLVDGFEKELGSFSLREMQSVKGPYGLGIERDLYFGQPKVGDIKRLAEWLKDWEDAEKRYG